MSKRKWIMAGIVVLAGLHLADAHGADDAPTPQLGARGTTGHRTVGQASDPDCMHTDIQNAIDAAVANDGGFSTINIRVSGPASAHEGNTYLINAQDFENMTHIRIIGGYDSCSDTSPSTNPSDRTVLDANENGRVFELLYNASLSDPTVTMELENLEISGGLADFAGGGIRIQGHAGRQRVRLSNVLVRNNATTSSGSGGGISLEANSTASGSVSWFRMSNNSQIDNNYAAGGGGGFACFNGAGSDNPPVVLFESRIVANEAAFNGGGVALSGCRNVSIRGNGFAGSITSNIAGAGNDGDGGGIHASNGAQLTLEASGTDFPFVVIGNEADRGGGIAVEGADTVASTQVELVNTRVHSNTARESGGGLHVADEASLVMGRHGGVIGFPGTCKPLSESVVRCSKLENNDSQGNAAAIAVRSGGQAEIFQTIIGENAAATASSTDGGVTHVSGSQSNLLIEGAWVYANSGSQTLMTVADGAEMHVRWSTIAGNPKLNEVSRVFLLESTPNQNTLLNLNTSIVWEPPTNLYSLGGSGSDSDSTVNIYCLITNDESTAGFDSVDFYSNIDPRLIDPSGGDLRLKLDSPAIDYCDDEIAPQFGDMFLNDRGVTYNLGTIEPPSSVPGGTFDIGAHERDPVQVEIFNDRFEE